MKWLAAAFLAALLLLQYRLWLSADGMRAVWRMQSAVAAQQAQNLQLADRNRRLAAEVEALKHGYAALEERARSGLGMIGPNETYYQVVTPAGRSHSAGTPAGTGARASLPPARTAAHAGGAPGVLSPGR